MEQIFIIIKYKTKTTINYNCISINMLRKQIFQSSKHTLFHKLEFQTTLFRLKTLTKGLKFSIFIVDKNYQKPICHQLLKKPNLNYA